MCPKQSRFRRILQSFRTIHLVDRCLILIMTILIFQSTYSLFNSEKLSPQNSNIDVVVRTSAAAIFGYFVSGNFIKSRSISIQQESPPTAIPVLSPENNALSGPQNRIGFFSPDSVSTAVPESGHAEVHMDTDPPIVGRLQIIVVTSVGIISLCVLLLYRNMCEASVATVGTLTQLRDFVSGCVGFLIGCETSEPR